MVWILKGNVHLQLALQPIESAIGSGPLGLCYPIGSANAVEAGGPACPTSVMPTPAIGLRLKGVRRHQAVMTKML